MRKWIVLVFIAVVCLAGCAYYNYPTYAGVYYVDDVYYVEDETPETPPDEEVIPEGDVYDVYYEDDEMPETPPDDEVIPEDDVYYEDDQMPETPPDDEGIPYILEYITSIGWHSSLDATPDIIIRSVDELHEFAETYFFTNRRSEQRVAYFSEIMARFDDVFFEDRMLILSYVLVHGSETKRFSGISLEGEDTLLISIGAYTPYWADHLPSPPVIMNYIFFISLEHMDEITTIVRW